MISYKDNDKDIDERPVEHAKKSKVQKDPAMILLREMGVLETSKQNRRDKKRVRCSDDDKWN